VGASGEGWLIVNGTGRYVHQSGSFRVGNAGTAKGTLVVAGGGRFESATNTPFTLPSNGSGSLIVTNGGTVLLNNDFRVSHNTPGVTGLVFIATGGMISNASTSANNSFGREAYSSLCKTTVSNGAFCAEGPVAVASKTNSVFPAAIVELDGTQRVFRIGSTGTLTVGSSGGTDRQGIITNHVRGVAGGVEILNTNATALAVYAGSKIHLAFDENPTQTGDFWGLRWAGTNGYARLVNYTNSGLIAVANNLTPPFNTNAIAVYKAADNSYTYIGFYAAVSGNVNGTIILVR
jgi:hypothetical protein